MIRLLIFIKHLFRRTEGIPFSIRPYKAEREDIAKCNLGPFSVCFLMQIITRNMNVRKLFSQPAVLSLLKHAKVIPFKPGFFKKQHLIPQVARTERAKELAEQTRGSQAVAEQSSCKYLGHSSPVCSCILAISLPFPSVCSGERDALFLTHCAVSKKSSLG